jgi:hypothetical protein
MAGANMDMPLTAAMPLHETRLAMPQEAGIEQGTPQYYALQKLILRAARSFLGPRCRAIDLSCSDGEMLSPLVKEACSLNHFIALDSSKTNAEACMDRFRFDVGLGLVEVGRMDLESDFPEVLSHLTLSIDGIGALSGARQDEVLALVCKHLDRRGGFILVERDDGGKDWEASLLEAGFREAKTIWRSGRYTARLATK